jgi:hypothetical protein
MSFKVRVMVFNTNFDSISVLVIERGKDQNPFNFKIIDIYKKKITINYTWIKFSSVSCSEKRKILWMVIVFFI